MLIDPSFRAPSRGSVLPGAGGAAVFRAWLLVGLAAWAAPAAAQGLVLQVDSTADAADASPGNGVCAAAGGACTLRAAIQEANASPGADAIGFAIGSGARTIALQSALPAITGAVTIDGWTQPGYAGQPLIFVDGGGARGTGLVVSGGGTTIRGLAIGNFNGDGVELRSAGGNVLEGNYVGMRLDGTTTAANSGHGVVVSGSPNNRIGGPTIPQRNLISKNTAKGNGGGIVLSGTTGNVIQGNFIGTDITGMVEHPNEARGIAVIGSSNNLIGGPGAGAGNLIAGNRATGVRMLSGSNDNVVQGNIIGLNRLMNAVIPNDRGVQIRDGSGNRVLGNIIVGNTYDGVLLWGATDTIVAGNIIAYNGHGPVGDPVEQGWFGIWVAEGSRNLLLSNNIYGNYLAGINLGLNIVLDPNDAGDTDGGANGLQNHPTLSSAVRAGAGTTISGVVHSSPTTDFIVQLFANPSCDVTQGPSNGEGQYFLGEVRVRSDAAGAAPFTAGVAAAVPVGWVVSATATSAVGTSEFSPCAVVR